MNFKPGDYVITRMPFFWHGEDIGDRLGTVISTEGHVLVNIDDYDDNPVKCFTWEIEKAGNQRLLTDQELEDLLDELGMDP
jgi:hypothetical protein